MNAKDANTLLEIPSRQKPLTDECYFCGTSRRDARLYDHKGCKFCRQAMPPKPDKPSYEEYIAKQRAWIAFKESGWNGGFTGFCKAMNLDESEMRNEPTKEEYENI